MDAEDRARDAQRRARLLPIGVGIAVFLTALINITPHPIGVFFDDAIYALVAKAIAAGQGYVYPQLPGTPPAIHYPPAFPLLLSLVWKVAPPFPDSTMWFKAVNPIVLGVAAWGAMRLSMRVFGWTPLAAAGIVVLGFVSVPTLVLTSVLLSEPLFLATLFPALLGASLLVERGGMKWAVLAGMAAALLVLTRTIGGVILPAVVLALLWERRWREAAAYAAVTMVLIMPWQLFVWTHAPGFPDPLRGSYGPYLEWVVGGYREGGMSLVLAVLRKNVVDAWSLLGIRASRGDGPRDRCGRGRGLGRTRRAADAGGGAHDGGLPLRRLRVAVPDRAIPVGRVAAPDCRGWVWTCPHCPRPARDWASRTCLGCRGCGNVVGTRSRHL
jgi:hypothetical protein